MTQDEMMASGAAQAADVGIGPTTDHTSARSCGQATEVTSGKRRRSWTAEQKRQIVAESLLPGASAAAVARKHGISSGQFYAWRQQLVLSGAFGAATAPRPSAVRADEPTAALSREAAVLSAPPEAEIRLPCGVSAAMADGSGIEDSPTSDYRSAFHGTIGARSVCVQADRSHDAEPDGAVGYALRRFVQGDCTWRSPIPGQQLFEFVLLGTAGDQAFQHIGKPGEWLHFVQLCRLCRAPNYAEPLCPAFDGG